MSPALSQRSKAGRRKCWVTAIVPAAGTGSRLGSRTKKPFVRLNGKPVLFHTLKAISSAGSVKGIIVAAQANEIARVWGIVKRFGLRKVVRVVAGGPTRFDSVKNCLDEVDASTDIVLIHDAARPLVSRAVIEGSAAIAARYGACVVAVPENDTVKLSDGRDTIRRTVDRKNIWRAQTPQTFRASLLKKAFYAPGARKGATDDSSVVERYGFRVRVLRGSYANIKITTREDLKIAEALL